MPAANPGGAAAGRPAAAGAGAGADGRPGELDPQRVAQRLVEQRQRQNAGWLMTQIRRVEHATLLFLASLWPGVGERHVAAREEEDAAQRRREEAAEAERVTAEEAAQEAARVAAVEGADTDGGGDAGQSDKATDGGGSATRELPETQGEGSGEGSATRELPETNGEGSSGRDSPGQPSWLGEHERRPNF